MSRRHVPATAMAAAMFAAMSSALSQGVPNAAPALIPSFENTRALPSDYRPPADDSEDEQMPLGRLRLALDVPLRTSESGFKGAGFQGSPAISPTLQAELRYASRDYWFGGLTFYRYLLGDRQRPWNPDFTYTFGYDDWHPGTFSLVYANYSGNRLSPRRGRVVEGQREERTRFSQGTWSAGYKFVLPEAVRPWFLLDESHAINCVAGANYTRRYTDLASRSLMSGKRSLTLGCRYATAGNWFANFMLYHYPKSGQRQPWDPDFTYGFGYFDWRPGSVSVQYNNYSGNRYPWNARRPGQGKFSNGSISISWSRTF